MAYLYDTKWIIQLPAGHKKTTTFHKLIHPEKMAVSSITVGEIYDVAFAYANPQAHVSSFRQFLAPFEVLTLNDPIMERFADVRSLLRRRGELISDFDILIGATALHYELALLTYNTRHFKGIPDLKLYPPAAQHSSLPDIIIGLTRHLGSSKLYPKTLDLSRIGTAKMKPGYR